MSETSLADTLKAAIAPPQGGAASDMISMADAATGAANLIAKAATDARMAERARAQAILTSPEAVGRESMATHLAFNTDMATEAAIDLLKVSGKTVPTVPVADPPSRLDQAMIDFKVSANAPPAETDADQVELGLAAAIDALVARGR